MNYYQQILIDEGIIETTLLAGVSSQDLMMSIQEAYQSSQNRGIHRYLVDASSANSSISLLTIFELPKLFSSLDFPRSSLIAVLSSRSQRGRERVRFFENVCNNRGWQVKQFYHRTKALEWLRKK